MPKKLRAQPVSRATAGNPANVPARVERMPRIADVESASGMLFDHYEHLAAAGDRSLEAVLKTARAVARDWEQVGRQGALFGLNPFEAIIAGAAMALAPATVIGLMAPHLNVTRVVADTWLKPQTVLEQSGPAE